MIKTASKAQGIEELKKISLENGDGIYLIYADRLTCDAIVIITVRDSKIESQTEMIPCFGLGDLGKQFKGFRRDKQDLPVYAFRPGFYTYPMEWRDSRVFLRDYIYTDVTYIEVPVTE